MFRSVLKVTHNGLQLPEGGDYEAQIFKQPLNMIRSNTLDLTTEPPLFGRCCYKQPFLVGFEESQAITKELRAKGIEAYSCDLQECSGGHPEWHLQMDIFQALKLKKWGGIILHPPCTFTALCGNRWYWNTEKRIEGIELCKNAWNEACKVCDYVALEQPKTIMQKYIGQRTQTIHPWQFGHGETKETWLWLKGFPKLEPTEIVEGRENKIWKMPPSKDRGKLRSKTYPGIARAISEQWF
jgi:hypothetical protein